MSTKLRAERRAELARKRAAELATAREVSATLMKSNQLTAWVYLATFIGSPQTYVTRFTAIPEQTIKDEPGSVLMLVAGFKRGKCVRSTVPDVQVEIPAATVRVLS